MQMPVMPTEKQSEAFTQAYGDWAVASNEVWRLAMDRIEGERPRDGHYADAMRAFDLAHERLKKAVDAL